MYTYAYQGSTITIKSPYVITYVSQNFGVRDVPGQMSKSIYQALYLFYLLILRIIFPKLIFI